MKSFMTDLKIQKKITVAFVIIQILYFITACTSIGGLVRVSGEFDNFHEHEYQTTQLSGTTGDYLQITAKDISFAILATDAKQQTQYLENAKNDYAQFTTSLNSLEKVYNGAQTQKLNEIVKSSDNLSKLEQQISDILAAKHQSEASSTFLNKYEPAMESVSNSIYSLNVESQNRADECFNAAKQTKVIVLITVCCLMILTIVVTWCLGVHLSRLIKFPVHEIQGAAKKMAAGQFSDVSFRYRSKDELGDLCNSIQQLADSLSIVIADQGYILSQIGKGNFTVKSNKMDTYVGELTKMLEYQRDITNSLSAAMTDIDEAASRVSAGSDQVSSAAQSLSQGATEQASTLEELTGTVGDISTKVQANARHAEKANIEAAACQKDMTESNQKMEQMVNAMNDISDGARQIAKIVQTIEGIAFQTNILALNASVEAAHAGAAGKGFAVVADEVRNLANKSQEASKNTSQLVVTSLKNVTRGTQIVNETAQALSKAVESIGRITSSIGKISRDSGEQASAVSRVSDSVEQISNVVQTNSATAEETAAASEELSGQAQTLKKTVGQFQRQKASEERKAFAEVKAKPAVVQMAKVSTPEPEEPQTSKY